MKNEYLAKTRDKKTIKEHTQDLLKQYEILKNKYPNILEKEEWKTLEDAIKYHDLGKMNSKFQNKLYEKLGYKERLTEYIKGEEIPHNCLSPYFINAKRYREIYGKDKAKLLVSAVYYHHARFADQIEDEEVKEDLQEQLKDFGTFFDLELDKPKANIQRYLIKADEEELKSPNYIMIKGLLNKIDYIASLDNEKVKIEEDTKWEGKTIGQIMQEKIEKEYLGNYREVQKYMKEHQDENIIIISPCGTGKTEAALLWIGKEKAFYTLPLKVSINAILERITEKIGYKKAVLLHSDAFNYYVEKEGPNVISYDRAKRLSAPFIITTADQLFKIVFRYCGYEEILATLRYSKVVIDEIQMYSPEIVSYILLGLKMITEMGGKFAIMTATFPPMLYDFLDKLEIPYKRQETKFKPNIDKKHRIKLEKNKDFNFNEIQKQGKSKKVLVICNTVLKAQAVYNSLKGENVYVLHSHYLKEDRKKLEKEVLAFSDREKHPESGIWIATQIVEASLDIDFDILYTDMCSLDSLFQRMGRIFRKREYHEIEPNVYIYDNKNGVPYVIPADIYEFSLEEIKKYDGKVLEEADKQKMIEDIFSLENNPKLAKSNYYKKIESTIEIFQDIKPYEIEKSEVNKLFRDISSIYLMPDSIYEKLEANGKIQEWKNILTTSQNIGEKLRVKNEIQNYIVSVRNTNKLEYDKEELFYPYSNIHRTPYQYEFDQEALKGRGLLYEKEENYI